MDGDMQSKWSYQIFNMENFASFNLYTWQAECGQNASVEESKN
jgi:hypothetical protein